MFALMATHSSNRQIDQDELVHLNGAYFASQGETLYASYFENYPPGMTVLLQPVVRASSEPTIVIRGARRLVLVLAAAILVATFLLGSKLGGTFTGSCAAALLCSQIFFVQKAMEVRPDVPAVLLMLAGFSLLPRALSPESRAGRRAVAGACAGALFCLAGLFTPKVIFAVAGATLAAGYVAARDASSRKPRAALRVIAAVTAGAAAVALAAVAEMARRGILGGFLADAVGASLRVGVENPAAFRSFYLERTLVTNAAGWALALFGGVILLRRRTDATRGLAEILVWSLCAGFLGLFLIAAPMRQVFLAFLPQAAIAGAAGLVDLLRRGCAPWPAAARFAVVAAALAAAAAPPWRTARAEAPAMDEQLAVIERVRAITAPDDRVLDCWTGLFLTRLPAYRYFYLNGDIQRMLPQTALEHDLLAALENPRVKVVIADEDCGRLPATVRRAIGRRFVPDAEVPFLLRRR